MHHRSLRNAPLMQDQESVFAANYPDSARRLFFSEYPVDGSAPGIAPGHERSLVFHIASSVFRNATRKVIQLIRLPALQLPACRPILRSLLTTNKVSG